MMRLGAKVKEVESTFTGALKNELDRLKTETFQETLGQITGRQSFYLVFKHLATDDSIRRTYNLQTLRYLKWLGDSEEKMRKWFHIATMMRRSILGVVEPLEGEYQMKLIFKKNMLFLLYLN